MVVTRRQSATPMPAAASRTNSSTGSSRSSKGKGVDKSSALKEAGAGPSRVQPNGVPSKIPPVGPQDLNDIIFDDDVSPTPPRLTSPKTTSPKLKVKTKTKRPHKAKKHDPNKGISVFDILARLFLLCFTIYTLSVCPNDVELRSPVCRALTEYRRAILEPYVYPPIRAALDHPSIAPHIQRAQPYYNHAVKITTPLVRRSKREWRTKVVPRAKWLQIRTRPYVRRMERQYDVILGPYVRQCLAVYKAKVDPYILAAAFKTRKSWKTARPYVIPLWRGATHVPGIVLRLVAKPLSDARRQWVDPQVAKIWDAVVEQGKADETKAKFTSSPIASQMTEGVSSAAVQASSLTSTLSTPPNEPSTSVETSIASLGDVPQPSGNGSSIFSLPVPKPTDPAAASASSIVADTVSPSIPPSNFATSTISVDDVPEPSSEHTLSVEPLIPEPIDEAAISASSIIQESLSGFVEPVVATSSEVPPVSSSSDHKLPPEEDDGLDDLDDLEKFLSEIGLDDPDDPELPPPPPPPPQVHEETEEEKAERLRLKAIATAEKRADIEGRHDQWEIDLERFGKAQRKVVRETLKRLRDAAAEEARTPGAAVRIHVEGLVQEGEKSLKSLKAYSRRLIGEDKSQGEKVKTWETVVAKVDEKFGDRVDAAADAVRDWWSAHINRENQEIGAIAEEVAALAERAQADLGMDYSWLGDVTYNDWQRYHRLIKRSKEFTEMYLAMQNGTLANAPVNPVSDVMEALQEEVDDLILGFEANLGRVKSAAIDAFSEIELTTATSASTSTSQSEPEVSILPIGPIAGEKKEGGIPPVILSRGAEEIKAAVSRAEEAKTQAAREEL